MVRSARVAAAPVTRKLLVVAICVALLPAMPLLYALNALGCGSGCGYFWGVFPVFML